MLFASWNINGLRKVEKLKYVFSTIQQANIGITFLQETFWDDEFIENYKHLWNGHILYNNYNVTNRRGVALLISRNFPHDVSLEKCDSQGRIIEASFIIDDVKYILINVYAPNENTERIEFHNKLANYINSKNVIIGGDFNEVLDPHLDRSNSITYNTSKSRQVLKQFIVDKQLCDIWRYRNYEKRMYTRQQHVEGKLKQSRLDYFLISRSLIENAVTSYIKYSSISDHALVCLKLDFSRVERGPGIWILNNTLLNDIDYCTGINEIIKRNIDCPLYSSETLIWWDNLKFQIKRYSIRYATNKKKTESCDYYKLHNELQREYAKAAQRPQYDVTRIKYLETELMNSEKIKCEGAILRSKVQWAFEGDRNTSFFLKLEKSKQESSCIKEIISEDTTLKTTKDILDYTYEFYSKLYTAEEIDEAKQEQHHAAVS